MSTRLAKNVMSIMSSKARRVTVIPVTNKTMSIKDSLEQIVPRAIQPIVGKALRWITISLLSNWKANMQMLTVKSAMSIMYSKARRAIVIPVIKKMTSIKGNSVRIVLHVIPQAIGIMPPLTTTARISHWMAAMPGWNVINVIAMVYLPVFPLPVPVVTAIRFSMLARLVQTVRLVIRRMHGLQRGSIFSTLSLTPMKAEAVSRMAALHASSVIRLPYMRRRVPPVMMEILKAVKVVGMIS